MKYNTIAELRDGLQKEMEAGTPLEDLQNHLLAYEGTDWKDNVRYSKSYSRQQITYTDLFDIILICWNEGAQTSPHDHPENGCILTVLEGKIKETRYKKQSDRWVPFKEANLRPGKTSYIEKDEVIHQITNTNNKRSVSLHIYAPAFYTPNSYTL